MKELKVKPGDVVVTNFGMYQHWSLVTDRMCELGNYMLISATKRNGTVQEEAWHTVTGGKETYVAQVEGELPLTQVLANARSQIGTWVYSVTDKNCEHFVKWASGIQVSSTQVKAGVAGALTGVAAVAALSENPKLIKFLGGALVIGGLAVYAAKALEKPSNEIA
ncbi:lecithin retinol acyltransferase family protein [Thiomicrorhabdus hydrogeniphila]